MNKRDYENYLGVFDSMIKVIPPPDLLIYLKSDIPKLVERIQKRGRAYENAIRLDYLKTLNEHYTEWIEGYELGKLMVIDVNHIDFVENVEDFSMIVNRIDVEINGLFS
jgi:deoxyadenosine/deoxycytidine kinase